MARTAACWILGRKPGLLYTSLINPILFPSIDGWPCTDLPLIFQPRRWLSGAKWPKLPLVLFTADAPGGSPMAASGVVVS